MRRHYLNLSPDYMKTFLFSCWESDLTMFAVFLRRKVHSIHETKLNPCGFESGSGLATSRLRSRILFQCNLQHNWSESLSSNPACVSGSNKERKMNCSKAGEDKTFAAWKVTRMPFRIMFLSWNSQRDPEIGQRLRTASRAAVQGRPAGINYEGQCHIEPGWTQAPQSSISISSARGKTEIQNFPCQLFGWSDGKGHSPAVPRSNRHFLWLSSCWKWRNGLKSTAQLGLSAYG